MDVTLVCVLGVGVLVQLYYWLIYFPRAWGDGSNAEINAIKAYVQYLRSNGE